MYIVSKRYGYLAGLLSSVKLNFTVKNRGHGLIQLLMLLTLIAAATCLPACSKKTTRKPRRTKPGRGTGKPRDSDDKGGDHCDDGQIEYETSSEETDGATSDELVPNRFKARASMMMSLRTSELPVTLSTPTSVSFAEDCYYIYYYCMKFEKTGKMCIQGPYWNYKTVNSGCELSYLNCIELYDQWKIAYMGECFNVTKIDYHNERYPYLDDYFLDAYYVVPEDQVR